MLDFDKGVRAMDKVKEHNRLDKMIARTKELQKEIDHRHEVEEKVLNFSLREV